MKTCNACCVVKPLGDFYADKQNSDGRRGSCKSCNAKRAGELYLARRTEYLDQQKQYKASLTAECSVDGCTKTATSRRREALCHMHNRRKQKHGDVHTVLPRGSWTPGVGTPHWLGDEVGYTGAHGRIKSQRGRASEHACLECESPAAHWSYRCGSAKERTDQVPTPHGRGGLITVKYSPDPSDYDALCVSCHTKRDRIFA